MSSSAAETRDADIRSEQDHAAVLGKLPELIDGCRDRARRDGGVEHDGREERQRRNQCDVLRFEPRKLLCGVAIRLRYSKG